jgi:hypothetical protein
MDVTHVRSRESREETYDLVERNRQDDHSVHAFGISVASRLETLAGL